MIDMTDAIVGVWLKIPPSEPSRLLNIGGHGSLRSEYSKSQS